MKDTWYTTLNVDYGHLLDVSAANQPSFGCDGARPTARAEPFLTPCVAAV
jgi:hypothetical protein